MTRPYTDTDVQAIVDAWRASDYDDLLPLEFIAPIAAIAASALAAAGRLPPADAGFVPCVLCPGVPVFDSVADLAAHMRADHCAAGVAAGRRQAADAIRAALAEDLADSDVSSGEAIWEQGGYRDGLRTAAELAAPAEPVEGFDR